MTQMEAVVQMGFDHGGKFLRGNCRGGGHLTRGQLTWTSTYNEHGGSCPSDICPMGQMSQGQLSVVVQRAFDHGGNVSGAIVWGTINQGAIDQGQLI